MSSHSSAGLQSLDAKLPPSHDAAATAGQRLGDRGRHHVLPARRELDLPCSGVAHSSVTACTRLCEASSIHAEETEQTRSLKLLIILPPRVKVCLSPCRFLCATTGRWYSDRAPTAGWWRRCRLTSRLSLMTLQIETASLTCRILTCARDALKIVFPSESPTIKYFYFYFYSKIFITSE